MVARVGWWILLFEGIGYHGCDSSVHTAIFRRRLLAKAKMHSVLNYVKGD